MADMIYQGSHSPTHSAGKSSMRQWYERMGGGTLAGRTKQHVTEGAHAIRAAGETAVVAGALGAVAAKLPGGLDISVPKSAMKVPIDGLVAAVGLVGAVAMAHEPIAADLRNAGAAALAVLTYRKTKEFVAEKLKSAPPAIKGARVRGEFGAEDPIVTAARAL